ncbi:2-phospho-L-lactate transferase [Aquipuribacter nitratireducens]|uniref:2-phospho-L-lactate transferase n=1 Tax=Aquipuribacter nitratireducens TaxID=650104 RepID=A0ABW0GN95_9MICO
MPPAAPDEPDTSRAPLRVAAVSGGVGGARFLRGLRDHLDAAGLAAEVTVVANTGDDITLHGLRVCPDLDTLMYTLGGGVDETQGWGRAGDTHEVAAELAAYGAGPAWFTLGDRDLATHLVRTRMLGAGYPLSEVTRALCERWQPGVRLLPMSDQPVETHVVVADPERRAVHLQEWWVRLRAEVPALGFPLLGLDAAAPGPGVLDALRGADVVLLPPSNPVVSLGPVLALPGVRDALRGTAAPVVGVSPLVGGRAVRGMAEACLAALDVPATAAGVATLLADVLDAWLVDDTDLADTRAALGEDAGRASAGPSAPPSLHGTDLLMRDRTGAARLAGTALQVALDRRAAA